MNKHVFKRTLRSSKTADATRSKTVEAAGELFAEFGFHHASVRQICDRAGVNVAAINYHFGDKTGLYMEVLRQSVLAARLEMVRLAFDQDAKAEEILRAVIRARLESLRGQNLHDWHFRIFVHELGKPTPLLGQLVNEAIRPIYQRMREVVGTIMNLPSTHDLTRLCANSIIGQILIYAFARPVLDQLGPKTKITPHNLDLIADHIADFSLAYLKQAARTKRQIKRTRKQR